MHRSSGTSHLAQGLSKKRRRTCVEHSGRSVHGADDSRGPEAATAIEPMGRFHRRRLRLKPIHHSPFFPGTSRFHSVGQNIVADSCHGA